LINTAIGVLRDASPVSFQDIDGRRVEVGSEYVLRGRTAVGIDVSEYDRSEPLVIDPELEYGTYIGGSNEDRPRDMVIDGDGNIYVIGETWSNGFPTVPGSYDTTFGGAPAGFGDAFVLKLDATGSSLIYSTFLGGGGADIGGCIVVDDSGNAYVSGKTESLNFPTTAGAFDTTQRNPNGFVAKLDPNGTALEFSTFMGTNTSASIININTTGHIFVAGTTYNAQFPTTPGCYDDSHNGDADLVFLILDPSGSRAVYSTFIGGSDIDYTRSMQVTSDRTVYLQGWTQSTDFPLSVGALDSSLDERMNTFILKLDITTSTLVYSTLISGTDLAPPRTTLVVDKDGCAYITGTVSHQNFTTTSGAYDESYNGGDYDAYVLKLSANGTSLEYSTYLGGAHRESGRGIWVNETGHAFVVAFTRSSAFPTTTD
ncbi:MAG: SBBP repeat-containing protein, partial [Thermoplasmata archaeon]|nr:SBBP repeat-containing protein [Thermoplasmata archaeon]